MQLTKQQKVYGAILCLAVACFCIDRWVIGAGADEAAAPSKARKSPSTARRPAARTPQPAVATEAKSQPAAPSASVAQLANRLQEAARNQGRPLDLEQVKDAFRPSQAFLPVRAEVTVVQPPPPTTAPARDEVAEFIDAHKLQAVMKRTNGGVAIVDKKTVKVGQSFAGFRLVAVKDRSAVFRRGRLRAELKLPDDVVAGEILPWGASEKIVGNEIE